MHINPSKPPFKGFLTSNKWKIAKKNELCMQNVAPKTAQLAFAAGAGAVLRFVHVWANCAGDRFANSGLQAAAAAAGPLRPLQVHAVGGCAKLKKSKFSRLLTIIVEYN